jgi:hypothetical protein
MDIWADDSGKKELLSFLGGERGFTAIERLPPEHLLADARYCLDALRTRHATADRSLLLAHFMGSIGRVAVRIKKGDFGNEDALHTFLAETSVLLDAQRDALLSYPHDLLLLLEDEADWQRVYRRRSALQFFVELYKRAAPALITALDYTLAPLDEQLWRHALPTEKIDRRMPRSHWWWWT